MQKPLIGNTLHHETDLVGVRNQEETGPRAADASEDVVHPSAANVLCELAPAPLDPILDRVLVSGWTGQLGKLFHQLEHELDLPGDTTSQTAHRRAYGDRRPTAIAAARSPPYRLPADRAAAGRRTAFDYASGIPTGAPDEKPESANPDIAALRIRKLIRKEHFRAACPSHRGRVIPRRRNLVVSRPSTQVSTGTISGGTGSGAPVISEPNDWRSAPRSRYALAAIVRRPAGSTVWISSASSPQATISLSSR